MFASFLKDRDCTGLLLIRYGVTVYEHAATIHYLSYDTIDPVITTSFCVNQMKPNITLTILYEWPVHQNVIWQKNVFSSLL